MASTSTYRSCAFLNPNSEVPLGKSAGWSIPSEDIQIIIDNNFDNYLKGKGITYIEELLGSKNSRRTIVAQATEFALYSRKIKTVEMYTSTVFYY